MRKPARYILAAAVAATMRTARINIAVLILCMMPWTNKAAAGDASVGYPPSVLILDGGAALNGAGVDLPATGDSGYSITFALPANYRNNRPVRIIHYLKVESAPCVARFRALQLVRGRIGVNTLLDPEGLTADDGKNTVQFPDAGIVAKTFSVRPSSLFPTQRKGDLLIVNFRREANAVLDSCDGKLRVLSVDVQYQTP